VACAARQDTRVVGYVRASDNDPFREAFVRGMRDPGYVEGRKIAFEFRHYGDERRPRTSAISCTAAVALALSGGIEDELDVDVLADEPLLNPLA
jgi:hypothetical protein